MRALTAASFEGREASHGWARSTSRTSPSRPPC